MVERVTFQLTASQMERMLAHQYAPQEYTDAQWLEERHAPLVEMVARRLRYGRPSRRM